MKNKNTAPFLLLLIVACFACRQSPNTLFVSVSPSSSNVHFTNKLEKHKAFGILYYLYYYNGGGVATGDINNDGLPDIYFTANNKGGNKLYLNKGNFIFEDITEKSGTAGSSDWCTGVTMADVNGDGWLDIYVCAVQGEHNIKGRNELFINDGKGAFKESAEQYGLALAAYSTQSVFFDYDHDGDLDCFILNQSHHPNENIKDTSNRHRFDPNAGDRLYRNDLATTGKFADVSAEAGIYQSSLGYGLGIGVADLNNDGWEDIYIGNDFHENDYYYINDGKGHFTESGASHFGHYSRFSMGNDIADYNNDGQPDIVTVDMLPPDEKTLKTYGSDENFDIYQFKILHNGFQQQVSRNCLQRNNGNGESFSDVALMAGISATDWSWCPLMADFDNDGNKDLFISSGIVKRPVDLDYVRFVSDLAAKIDRNGSDEYDAMTLNKMPDGASKPFLFQGDGQFEFSNVSDSWGTGKMKGYFNGASYADLNNDGQLDLVINSIESPATILKNTGTSSHFLTLGFKGEGRNENGIGAKVWVINHGKLQYQQLMLTRGFQSSVEARLHFGLNNNSSIDSLLVVWPNQQYQLLTNLRADTGLVIEQKNAAGHFDYQQFFQPKPPAFEDISNQIALPWKHQENSFTDFNVQYLIPHLESSRGPGLAVADVNKDGLDDFFVCGAMDHAGKLFIQSNDGRFYLSDSSVLSKASSSEQVAALFFDANNDGWPDLYVVSGGNQYLDGNPALADHLYLNDTKGHLLPQESFPSPRVNKTCIAAADIDHDGDNDLFIGGFASARSYGIAQQSYLLINDGKGNFKQAAEQIADLHNTGMTTSAAFADINGDGWQDLLVSGEWTAIKIFINNKGHFSETAIAQSTGLWQTLSVGDINGDGAIDILAGNWGYNSKLYEGKTSPLKLFVKDFDKNGSIEQVMTYNVNGKDYTFLAKDELEREMPVLKKAYLTYSEVAGQTVQYMFYDLFTDYTELKAETLGSAVFINDGKGNFTKNDLPKELQMAPLMAFATDDNKRWLGAGNFFGVIPYEGRYDALRPTIFEFNKSKTAIVKWILPAIGGEIRDAKWIKTKDGRKVLALARNNDSIVFLQEPPEK